MARRSPIHDTLTAHGAITAPYGPPESSIEVVQTFGHFDQEYAALRKGAGLFDNPMLGCLEITGADRVDFLNRMLTQELKGFAPFTSVASFWLSRKGRIDADLRLVALPDRILAFVDAHAAARALQGLSGYVITEDVVISDRTDSLHTFALHGPSSRAIIAHCATHTAGSPIESLAPASVAQVTIAGLPVTIHRHDLSGEIGLHLTAATPDAPALFAALLALCGEFLHGDENAAFRPRVDPFHLRICGWAALNTARIEAGNPLYLLDFGTDSLVHESGVLSARVSFTKGCYLGQEIVARMQSLGSPKQKLAPLRLERIRRGGSVHPTDQLEAIEADFPLQPETGSAVFVAPAADVEITPEALGEPVGGVTSSAISPMLGSEPVCFAMIRTKHTLPGTALLVEAEGRLLRATVQKDLAFYRRI